MRGALLASDSAQVHLWTIRISQCIDQLAVLGACLSADELERAQRYHADADRDHFTAARAALRHILAQYMGIAPGAVCFAYTDRGKPSLSPGLYVPGLHFNASRSGDLCLIAVTRDAQVGVDVELARPIEEQESLVRQFFSAAERECIRQAGTGGAGVFYRFWTAKEAYLKAVGAGLEALGEVDCSLAGAGAVSVRAFGAEQKRWSVFTLEPAPSYVGCVAVGRASVKLVEFVFRFQA